MIPADKANSTYWWIFNLDNTKPENKIQKMYGYSKFQGQAEAISKINCLCAKVEMMQKYGWIDRSNSIEIYEKIGAFPCAQSDIKLMVLYKTTFVINPLLVGKIDNSIMEFLRKFYIMRTTGKPVENLRPLSPPVTKDELYVYAAGKFKTPAELYNWCNKKISEGENRERVLHYYREYLLRNFSEFNKLTAKK